MLTSLTIHHLALVQNLELDVYPGTTAITGETGSGKSILIDALQVALGDRADSQLVRHGAARGYVCLHFDITSSPATYHLLQSLGLEAEQECTLRRVINADGRSKAYINDTPVSAHTLREVGNALVDIHGQHAHHALLNPIKHLALLDNFARHQDLLDEVASTYHQWHHVHQQWQTLHKALEDKESRLALLSFQKEELSALALEEKSWEVLLSEHKQQANAEQLLSDCAQALNYLSMGENHSALRLFNKAHALLNKYAEFSPVIANALTVLQQVPILLEEACGELHDLSQKIEINPHAFLELDQQISQRHAMARKYRIAPEALPDLLKSLTQEFEQLQSSDEQLDHLFEQRRQLEAHYITACARLSASRKKAAVRLSQEITQLLKSLAMPDAAFDIALIDLPKDKFSLHGSETAEFRVNTNPGMPWYPLHKIASGGELSRISLAIQVVAAQQGTIPVLVFDEVDVGIGGSTAERVGELLRRLGEHAQVLNITHQPQVAAKAHQHWRVEKLIDNAQTFTRVHPLSDNERIDEIARMLGGSQISAHTLAHAKEIISLT